MVCVFAFRVQAQETPCSFQVVAQLVTKNLDLKAIPKLKIYLRESIATRRTEFSTGFDGRLSGQLRCGSYSLTTGDPVEFEGKKYSWDLKVDLVPGSVKNIELSVDNATAELVPSGPPSNGRATDPLAAAFKKFEPAVVTVWSEIGHGTGFFVDEAGLILTNQHVIGPSEYIAVQSDDEHKVRAVLLASDPEKDVAVLWVNRSGLPATSVAPLAKDNLGESIAVEGERVFTIGSPLSQQKIMTTGIVSKVEDRAIISDININPGNSGGPLFNSLGYVIGLTTFSESAGAGPGISGIIRIEQVEGVLDAARTKIGSQTPPSASLLPVEPRKIYPIAALKAAVSTEHFDARPYVFEEGDYDVAIITPVLKYNLAERGKVEAAKEKARRNRKAAASAAAAFQPLDEMRNWAEYAGEYKAVIQIRASPKLRETFGSALTRALTSTQYGVSTLPAKMRFKADFYRMVLRCGNQEIEPIQPGKIARMINVKDRFVNATDATYEGLYTYPLDAISPTCGDVSLDIYSEKNVLKAQIKGLSKKTVERVWEDGAPARDEATK